MSVHPLRPDSGPVVGLRLDDLRMEWCDDCLVHHPFANVLDSDNLGSRLGVWADHVLPEPIYRPPQNRT